MHLGTLGEWSMDEVGCFSLSTLQTETLSGLRLSPSTIHYPLHSDGLNTVELLPHRVHRAGHVYFKVTKPLRFKHTHAALTVDTRLTHG